MQSAEPVSPSNRGPIESPSQTSLQSSPSFDLSTAKRTEQSRRSFPKNDARPKRRVPDRDERPRSAYSSPPPDYRSSIKDRTASAGPGSMPSYYNVHAMYARTPSNSEAPPTSFRSDAPFLNRTLSTPIGRDASVRSPRGLQKILKGWEEHQASRRNVMGRILRRESKKKTNETGRDEADPISYQSRIGVLAEVQSCGLTPAAFNDDKPVHELSAEAGVALPTASTTHQQPDDATTAIAEVGDCYDRPVVYTPKTPVQADAEGSSSPWSDSTSSPRIIDREENSSTPGITRWRRTHSRRRSRPTLEDVPEQDADEVFDKIVNSSQKTPTSTSLPAYLFNCAALATSAYLGNIASCLIAVNKLLPVEPAIPAGHTRVRWTCKCGAYLYDDFVENVPGAADRLQAELHRLNSRCELQPHKSSRSAHTRSRVGGGSGTPSRSGSNGGSSIFSVASSTASSATSTGDIGESSLNRGGSNSSHHKATSKAGNEAHLVRLGSEAEVPWLLTCCAEARLTPKLTHLSMDPSTVSSDRDLAMALRQHYGTLHNGWSSFLRLRGLKSIDFVKFEVHRNRFADVRARPHMPPYPHPSSLPGYDQDLPENISWDQTTDYAFEPGHLVPPVGPHYLMHLFSHPHDYDTESITLKRMPKKLGGRLESGVGWGVELVEGFVTTRVWALLVGLMVIASGTFVGVWLTRGDRGDVQGAFAVAGWAVACVGVLGGWIGSLVE